jgi:hypothetical protein
MMNDKMRESFEAWECDSDDGPQTDRVWLMFDEKTNEYPLDKIQAHWEVWQASRSAVVIELPPIWEQGSNTALGQACAQIRTADIEAIEAAGLRVAS